MSPANPNPNPAAPSQRAEALILQAPGAAVGVRIEWDPLARLSREVMRGFATVPKRGAEVGGLLLGRIRRGNQPLVVIEDFLPVPSEYRNGPTYRLSDKDLGTMEDAFRQVAAHVAEGPWVVGFYRSHTREGFALTADDRSLLDRYLPDPRQVVLLIRPYATRVATAGVFLRENGQFSATPSFEQFPFRAPRDVAEAPPAEAPPERVPFADAPLAPAVVPEPVPAPVQRVIRLPEPPAAPQEPEPAALDDPPLLAPVPAAVPVVVPTPVPTRGLWFRRLALVPLALLCISLGSMIGYQVAKSVRDGGGPDPSVSLGLAAAVEGSQVRVTWDPNSSAVQQAVEGRLQLREGTLNSTVTLNPAQLRGGQALYRPRTPEVTAELEVVLPGDARVTQAVTLRATP